MNGINFSFTAELGPKTMARLERFMSQLSDAIAALTTSVADATTRVTTDISALKQKIADLESTVASGGATQADLDALAKAKADLDLVDPTTPSTVPPTA